LTAYKEFLGGAGECPNKEKCQGTCPNETGCQGCKEECEKTNVEQ